MCGGLEAILMQIKLTMPCEYKGCFGCTFLGAGVER